MRLFIVLFMMSLCPTIVFGQNDSLSTDSHKKKIKYAIQPYEGEIRYGLGGGGYGIGSCLALELRRNYNGKPYDLGVQLKFGVPFSPFIGDKTETSIALVGDLNGRQGKNFGL